MGRLRRVIIPLLIIVVLLVVVQMVMRSKSSTSAVKYSYQGGSQSFVSQLNSGDVKSVLVNTSAQTIQVTSTSGTYTIAYPDATLLSQLLAKHPEVTVSAKSGSSSWTGLLTLLLPVVLIIGFMIFIMRRMQGGGSKVMGFGKSRARQVSVDAPKVTFKDVAGIDETVEEL
ncbi:MAG: ATP-dependent metallopeptidase FtsH/Yme1/Tma family protein, partial [Thermoleophilia bacterium]